MSKDNDYVFSCTRNSLYYSQEFYLSAKDEYGFSMDKYLFISKEDKEIIIGNKELIFSVDIDEPNKGIIILEAMIRADDSEDMKINRKAYYEEFKINPKLLEIAKSGMKTLLKNNSDKTGKRYIVGENDKTVMSICLEKENYRLIKGTVSRKMYKIGISYNEFLRNPDSFRRLIQNPEQKDDWNFWCREEKYKERYFQ